MEVEMDTRRLRIVYSLLLNIRTATGMMMMMIIIIITIIICFLFPP
jgi:hypothetical protein